MPLPAPATDKQIINEIGIESLMALGHSEVAVKKWMQRGIPWKERAEVEELAAKKRKRLPDDFRKVRRLPSESDGPPPRKAKRRAQG